MDGVVLLLRSIRPCASMHGNALTFSEQVIASIIYDSRCGTSDVAFCTAPPFGRPQILKYIKLLRSNKNKIMTEDMSNRRANIHKRTPDDIAGMSILLVGGQPIHVPPYKIFCSNQIIQAVVLVQLTKHHVIL